jgi:simple sugar transport system ATP-binding protein
MGGSVQVVDGGEQTGSPPRRALNLLREAFVRRREASVLIIAIALMVYFQVANEIFLTHDNLRNIAQATAPTAIVAAGVVLLLVSGEIDLSIGVTFALAPFLMHYFADFYYIPALPSILLALVCAAGIGWLNGFVSIILRVPSFVATLGTFYAVQGFILTTSNAYPAEIPPSMEGTIRSWLGAADWSSLIWCLLIVGYFHVVLTRTRWGLHTISVGGNIVGATEAGIKVRRIKIGNFMIASVLAAFAGIMEAFRVHTIDPNLGGGAQIPFLAISAAVIGGTALAGARVAAERVQPHRHQRQPVLPHPRRRDPDLDGRQPVPVPPAPHREDVMGPDGSADVLRVEHVSKRFGALTALRDVTMHLGKGEVLGLIGDNGAGKSTLIKILCGYHRPDAGTVYVNGEEVTLRSVDHARSVGIDVVYQDLALVNELSVYHNMFLNRERVWWPFLNNRAMRRLAREHLADMGVNISDVDMEVAKLSGGQRQAIAVARSVYSDAKILLLDEPLAAMGAKEGALILDVLGDLKARAEVSIIIIAHNYAQVLDVCDRVNLLQHGTITFDKPTAETSLEELTDLMVSEYRVRRANRSS